MTTKTESIELADILTHHLDEYVRRYRPGRDQKKAALHIMACRTLALGGHVEICNECGHVQVRYHSCRNRHCPKCQTLTKERWLDTRKTELLPVKYFHVVFTLPHDINRLALCNKSAVYGILFRSVSETLKQFAKDPKRQLNGEMGFISILHTWDQKLNCHIHIHCMVPATALLPDHSGLTFAGRKYLFPVKALSLVFRGKFMEHLTDLYKKGELVFPGNTKPLAIPSGFKRLTNRMWSKKWVVYAKPPFKGPEDVLAYIARYTHRVAISNDRIISLENGAVTFSYRNRKIGKKERLTVDAVEFIRRFMAHLLPSGFMKIRHYGFLANRNKKQKIAIIRGFLGLLPELPEKHTRTISEMMLDLTGRDITQCPACKTGRLFHVAEIAPDYRLFSAFPRGAPALASA